MEHEYSGTFGSLFGKKTETTFTFFPLLSKYYVLNIPIFGDEIQISWSEKLTGPWSAWENIYQIPSPWNNTKKQIFCYAPKSHPELAKEKNEIVFSFASNSMNLGDLHTETQIYIPQLIRVLVNQ